MWFFNNRFLKSNEYFLRGSAFQWNEYLSVFIYSLLLTHKWKGPWPFTFAMHLLPPPPLCPDGDGIFINLDQGPSCVIWLERLVTTYWCYVLPVIFHLFYPSRGTFLYFADTLHVIYRWQVLWPLIHIKKLLVPLPPLWFLRIRSKVCSVRDYYYIFLQDFAERAHRICYKMHLKRGPSSRFHTTRLRIN